MHTSSRNAGLAGAVLAADRSKARPGSVWLTPRFLGALSVLAVGAVHLQQYLVSERTPLFEFTEPGYNPTAIMAARAAEIVAVVALGAFLAARFVWRQAAGSW